MRWLQRNQTVSRSNPASGPAGDALSWQVTQARAGARVTVTVHTAIRWAPFPHLGGIVLSAPYEGPEPAGWSIRDAVGGTDEDDSEIRMLAPILAPPIRNWGRDNR